MVDQSTANLCTEAILFAIKSLRFVFVSSVTIIAKLILLLYTQVKKLCNIFSIFINYIYAKAYLYPKLLHSRPRQIDSSFHSIAYGFINP